MPLCKLASCYCGRQSPGKLGNTRDSVATSSGFQHHAATRSSRFRGGLCTRASHGNGNGHGSQDESWQERAIPSYLQSLQTPACEEFEHAIQQAELKAEGKPALSCDDLIWQKIREEAQRDAAGEPLLSSFLYASILSHDNFSRSLSFVLANRLADITLLATELFEIFYNILKNESKVHEAALADIVAVKERDPACLTHSAALLYYKGYHAIQVYRIAHTLWQRGQTVLALALQSRTSEVFAVDIHPAARIGKGVLLDHGTGVVIGETAVVGNNVSIMQNVTLGGTGKEVGDRHPKISDNVLISAGATILGNITVGQGAQVAAGSLVLKPVPPCTMVAGSPAREIGKITWNAGVEMHHWMRTKKNEEAFCADLEARAQETSASAPSQPTSSPQSTTPMPSIDPQAPTINGTAKVDANTLTNERGTTGVAAQPETRRQGDKGDVSHQRDKGDDVQRQQQEGANHGQQMQPVKQKQGGKQESRESGAGSGRRQLSLAKGRQMAAATAGSPSRTVEQEEPEYFI